ncbi:P-loop NTPase fold protein [uncultured Aeromonas sp.]|uniref:KAP family P-loop NTPase fold protein n=1 Tax=uncultured Aeromonas sp. TaxID=263763 RepID=UPI002586D260|nr:P-loop NTPase fold protein [uncultured Aeromonas sp.]
MSKEFDIEWKKSVEIDGVSYCPDHLNRAKYALFLTSFLNSQDLSKPYVLNLNSGWGTGKTYFLKRWAEDLKRRHPVIYIDAWKDDHSDDPFMTVVSAIISSLRELTDKSEDTFLSKSCENGWSLLKAMGPMMVGAAAKKYLGKDLDELLSFNEENSPDISKEVGDAAAKLAQFLITSHEKKSASVKALKLDILGWIGSAVGQGDGTIDKPTFVIIDELDRCRPSYAVEMLEAIKHIFDIPGVFFIIATDTEQLQHAIKVVYGGGFDAQTYLSRFFDSRFSLRQPSLRGLIETHCNIDALSNTFLGKQQIQIWPTSEDQLANVISVLDAFKLSPRRAIHIVNGIVSSILYMKRGSSFDIIYLTILHCMRGCDFDLYNVVSGISHVGDFNAFFKGKSYVNSDIEIIVKCDVVRSSIMNVKLNKYFKSIFQYMCGIFEDSYSINTNLIRNQRAALVKEIESAATSNKTSDFSDEVFHIKAMQADYMERGLHRKEKGYYLDLVELSASFD